MENREEIRHLTEEEIEEWKQSLIDRIIEYFVEQKENDTKVGE